MNIANASQVKGPSVRLFADFGPSVNCMNKSENSDFSAAIGVTAGCMDCGGNSGSGPGLNLVFDLWNPLGVSGGGGCSGGGGGAASGGVTDGGEASRGVCDDGGGGDSVKSGGASGGVELVIPHLMVNGCDGQDGAETSARNGHGVTCESSSVSDVECAHASRSVGMFDNAGDCNGTSWQGDLMGGAEVSSTNQRDQCSVGNVGQRGPSDYAENSDEEHIARIATSKGVVAMGIAYDCDSDADGTRMDNGCPYARRANRDTDDENGRTPSSDRCSSGPKEEDESVKTTLSDIATVDDDADRAVNSTETRPNVSVGNNAAGYTCNNVAIVHSGEASRTSQECNDCIAIVDISGPGGNSEGGSRDDETVVDAPGDEKTGSNREDTVAQMITELISDMMEMADIRPPEE